MIIGLTDPLTSEKKFQQYAAWLNRGSEKMECLRLSYLLDNLSALDSCDGLVLTGGHDVHPSLYGGPANHPLITSIDQQRDAFEQAVFERASVRGIPILGICRGMQLVNVCLGGTLFPDLEEAGFDSHKGNQGVDARHAIKLEMRSNFGRAIGAPSGEVSSSHHQAVEHPGRGLKIVARASDGVIEAMETEGGKTQTFLTLVQWHPERMEDVNNPYTDLLLKYFISSILTNALSTHILNKERR